MGTEERNEQEDQLAVEPEELKDLDAPEEGAEVKGGFRSWGCAY